MLERTEIIVKETVLNVSAQKVLVLQYASKRACFSQEKLSLVLLTHKTAGNVHAEVISSVVSFNVLVLLWIRIQTDCLKKTFKKKCSSKVYPILSKNLVYELYKLENRLKKKLYWVLNILQQMYYWPVDYPELLF